MACKISDGELIDLLRGLRSGAVDNRFVHRVDVCSAAPEDLVADLEPAPGTDLTQDGYNSVWYFYCEKRFKNTQGKASGHRHRAIAGGDNTCWHAETRPKDVEGSQGGTFCNLSYGCKKQQGSQGRSFVRLGWCMTEYDDTQQMQMQHGGAGDNNYVLCKVYRSSSSLAKGKSKSSASSSSSKNTTTSSSKRKASGDHAETRPSKMIYEQMMHHQDTILSDSYPMPCYQEGMINPIIADVGCGVQQQYVQEQQQLIQQQYQDTIFSDTYPMPCYQGMINPMFSDMGCGVQQQLMQQQQQYVEEEQQLMQEQPINAEAMQQGGEFVFVETEWINCPEMFEVQQDQELQQQSGGFVETPVVVATQEANVGEGETTAASGEELAFVVQEEQSTQMEQQPGAEFVETPLVAQEANVEETTTSCEEQSTQMQQQQQPSAEEDPIADVIQYLKTTSTWLWPDSPSTCQASAAAMLYQQQEGSHYWMQPQQLMFPMC